MQHQQNWIEFPYFTVLVVQYCKVMIAISFKFLCFVKEMLFAVININTLSVVFSSFMINSQSVPVCCNIESTTCKSHCICFTVDQQRLKGAFWGDLYVLSRIVRILPCTCTSSTVCTVQYGTVQCARSLAFLAFLSLVPTYSTVHRYVINLCPPFTHLMEREPDQTKVETYLYNQSFTILNRQVIIIYLLPI